MSLFVLASKDGWVNIMYHGLDAVGVDQQVSNKLNKNDSRAAILADSLKNIFCIHAFELYNGFLFNSLSLSFSSYLSTLNYHAIKKKL